MAERIGCQVAFNDNEVVVAVYYDTTTGRPTRIVSDNSGNATAVTFTVSNQTKSYSGTRTIQPGHEEYQVPVGLASRINFATGDVLVQATHQP